MDLRDRGIYRLPNGRELVALVYPNKTPVLYNPDATTQVEYELNEAGRLLFQGRLTAWGIEDLSETGRTTTNDFAPIKPGLAKWDRRPQ